MNAIPDTEPSRISSSYTKLITSPEYVVRFDHAYKSSESKLEACVNIRNPSDSGSHLVFKFTTNRKNGYSTKPNLGILPPGCDQIISVTITEKGRHEIFSELGIVEKHSLHMAADEEYDFDPNKKTDKLRIETYKIRSSLASIFFEGSERNKLISNEEEKTRALKLVWETLSVKDSGEARQDKILYISHTFPPAFMAPQNSVHQESGCRSEIDDKISDDQVTIGSDDLYHQFSFLHKSVALSSNVEQQQQRKIDLEANKCDIKGTIRKLIYSSNGYMEANNKKRNKRGSCNIIPSVSSSSLLSLLPARNLSSRKKANPSKLKRSQTIDSSYDYPFTISFPSSNAIRNKMDRHTTDNKTQTKEQVNHDEQIRLTQEKLSKKMLPRSKSSNAIVEIMLCSGDDDDKDPFLSSLPPTCDRHFYYAQANPSIKKSSLDDVRMCATEAHDTNNRNAIPKKNFIRSKSSHARISSPRIGLDQVVSIQARQEKFQNNRNHEYWYQENNGVLNSGFKTHQHSYSSGIDLEKYSFGFQRTQTEGISNTDNSDNIGMINVQNGRVSMPESYFTNNHVAIGPIIKQTSLILEEDNTKKRGSIAHVNGDSKAFMPSYMKTQKQKNYVIQGGHNHHHHHQQQRQHHPIQKGYHSMICFNNDKSYHIQEKINKHTTNRSNINKTNSNISSSGGYNNNNSFPSKPHGHLSSLQTNNSKSNDDIYNVMIFDSYYFKDNDNKNNYLSKSFHPKGGNNSNQEWDINNLTKFYVPKSNTAKDPRCRQENQNQIFNLKHKLQQQHQH